MDLGNAANEAETGVIEAGMKVWISDAGGPVLSGKKNLSSAMVISVSRTVDQRISGLIRLMLEPVIKTGNTLAFVKVYNTGLTGAVFPVNGRPVAALAPLMMPACDGISLLAM